ncbi:MAG: hypothetical protein V5804_01685 [Mucilaginibacter sp.]|uniref:hypothetical protein n=1 Tax=Mucilaginibacter sp. TaxID=1882438 RepID=UPI0034E40DA0
MALTLLLRKSFLAVLLCFFCGGFALAQTDADAIMIPKNYFCGGAMYSNSRWDNYWEGTFKRSNGNIGTLNSNMVTLMGNYGISNRLNVLFSLPYITNNVTAGTLHNQQGIQDATVSLKWVPVVMKTGYGTFRLFAIAMGSVPIGNYQADFLPVAIGLHSRSLMFRALADYQSGHLFFSGSGEYMRRDNITIDRTAYYTTEMHYTNQVGIPDGTNFNFRGGYRSSKLIAEAVLDNNTTLGGFDIRKNDMPFPSNKMNMTTVGVNFKYSFSSINGLELTAGSDYAVAGRNVGQSTVIHGGAYYLFNLKKNKINNTIKN